jgi:hypothetical protein
MMAMQNTTKENPVALVGASGVRKFNNETRSLAHPRNLFNVSAAVSRPLGDGDDGRAPAAKD